MSELGWESSMKATRLDGLCPSSFTMSVVLQWRSTFSVNNVVGVDNVSSSSDPAEKRYVGHDTKEIEGMFTEHRLATEEEDHHETARTDHSDFHAEHTGQMAQRMPCTAGSACHSEELVTATWASKTSEGRSANEISTTLKHLAATAHECSNDTQLRVASWN